MTAKELAEQLDGKVRGNETSLSDCIIAAKSGLVVVYCTMDDLLEIEGAIYNEIDLYNGCTCLICNGEVFGDEPEECHNDECQYYGAYRNSVKSVTAVYHEGEYPRWTVETNIPHETFRIEENGEPFSIGIVFDIEDTKVQLVSFDSRQWSGCEYCSDEEGSLLDWKYGLDGILPDYKFCPMCGSPLTADAWAELEQRVGGNHAKSKCD